MADRIDQPLMREARQTSIYEAESGIIPIQIRPALVVRIAGIPWDLTPAEANKIASVVLALMADRTDEERAR